MLLKYIYYKLIMNKIEKYIFFEISKGCLLILFIFLSISWLLQFTRLVSLTNLIQVDIFTIFYLSIFLIPNLVTIILPIVIMFGLVLSFLKLHRDKEIISIYALGLKTNAIIKTLFFFSFISILFLLIFNMYLSPKIYNEYKIKEHEIRNKIDFEKIIVSNFLEINKNTFLDFKKNKKKYEEVFIKFKNEKDNFIFAHEATITQDTNKFIFKLVNGFRITVVEKNKIEKLEFENYKLNILNNNFQKYDNFDKNTFSIFDDIKNEDYLNIVHKITDIIIVIIIILFFYFNNIKYYKFDFYYLTFFLFISSGLLILNQVIKNLEINYVLNILIISSIFIFFLIYFFISKKNV
jgi:lipopolysaccharide export LptBFGC system permease protein LptF